MAQSSGTDRAGGPRCAETGEESGDLVRGLPLLLAAAGGAAHPNRVAAALVDGPGRALGAVGAAICWARPPHLVVLGLHGFPADEVDGLETIGLDLDHPLPHSYHRSMPIVVDAEEFLARYAVATATSRSARALSRTPVGSVVSAPIVARGMPVGSFALLCERRFSWSPADVFVLGAVGSTLGVWLTHPVSGLPPGGGDEPAPVLTDRQRAVLALLAESKTNEAVASSLGVSASTVKQEVGRIIRALKVRDRRGAVRRAVELGLVEQGCP